MLKSAFWSGIASGMLVGIGGTVYLSCENKVAGAVLFSVALLCICLLGLYLYTGKIGVFMEKPDKKSALALPVGLGGNVVGAALTGVLTALAPGKTRVTLISNSNPDLTYRLYIQVA